MSRYCPSVEPVEPPAHIKIQEIYNRAEKIVAASTMPEVERFRTVIKTINGTKCEARVPVELIKIFSFDNKGTLVAPKNSISGQILYFGIDGNQLDSIRFSNKKLSSP